MKQVITSWHQCWLVCGPCMGGNKSTRRKNQTVQLGDHMTTSHVKVNTVALKKVCYFYIKYSIILILTVLPIVTNSENGSYVLHHFL